MTKTIRRRSASRFDSFAERTLLTYYGLSYVEVLSEQNSYVSVRHLSPAA